MDGQVAIKQVLGMFSAKVRDSDSNAEKVRASEKHPWEWFSHHGWTKHRHMTWWRPLAGSCWGWPFLPRLQPVWALMESLHAGMPVPSYLTSGDANFGFAQALWVAWGWNGRRTGAKHGGGHLEWPHSCGHPLLTSNLLRWRWPSHGSLGERPSNF